MKPQDLKETAIKEKTVAWRRALHQDPEISGNEVRTAAKVAAALEEMGLEPFLSATHHGVSATIEGALPGPMVALRADMDALPIFEEVDVPFRSKNDGVMHACGHDMHVATLLATALRLIQNKARMRGKVRLIFQPQEELAPKGGAYLMIRDGFLKDVKAIFALHEWPDQPCGRIAVKAGPMMAASDRFKLKVFGQAAHAAHPHQGVDAIIATADILQEISQIVSRRLNPVAAACISIGTIHGGDRYNVIPSEVTLEGTVRTLDEEARAKIPECMKAILEGKKISHGLDYDLSYNYGYPVLDNWEEPELIVENTVRSLYGPKALISKVTPELTAEDFSIYLKEVPGAFLWLGCGRQGEPVHGLHNSQFCPDEEALHIGSTLMTNVALNALEALVKGVDMSKR